MGDPTSYRKPRKFNFVTILLVLGGIVAIYMAFQYLPAYYRKWQVKGVLAESANSIYPRRFMSGPGAAEFLGQLQTQTLARLRSEVGIDDPSLSVRAHKDAVHATVSADYRERISHPFVSKTTVLRFRPWVQIELKAAFTDEKK